MLGTFALDSTSSLDTWYLTVFDCTIKYLPVLRIIYFDIAIHAVYSS